MAQSSWAHRVRRLWNMLFNDRFSINLAHLLTVA
jgi:hypothetical protein